MKRKFKLSLSDINLTTFSISFDHNYVKTNESIYRTGKINRF